MKKKLKAEDIFAIIGIICILVGAYVLVSNAMSPAEGVRYQADICSSGCNGTANFDACFQACMWRE